MHLTLANGTTASSRSKSQARRMVPWSSESVETVVITRIHADSWSVR
jgi:hypothetical protein